MIRDDATMGAFLKLLRRHAPGVKRTRMFKHQLTAYVLKRQKNGQDVFEERSIESLKTHRNREDAAIISVRPIESSLDNFKA